MILTVLGGSAHSTPALVDSLGADSWIQVRLVGRDQSRLSAVVRACRVLTGHNVAQYGWEALASALTGSDAVLIQVRPGGYAGRQFDETFPLSRDVPGDEGLGPGGLSAAWRGWPVLRQVFVEVGSCAPNARVILLTSPGSLLVRLAAMEFPGWPLLSVCELPWTTLQTLCGDADAAADATFDYHGVNHLGWLYDVVCDGDDMVGAYAAGTQSNRFPPRELVRRLGAYPLKYLRLHYATAEVVREQAAAPGVRATDLASIADNSYRVFANGSADEMRSALGARNADWYAQAIAPLLKGFAGKRCPVPIFATKAEGKNVVERHYRMEEGDLIEAPPRSAPPDEVVRTVQRFIEYEELAASAVLSGTEAGLARALSIHPWVRSRSDARYLAAAIVSQRNGNDEKGAYA